MYCIYN